MARRIWGMINQLGEGANDLWKSLAYTIEPAKLAELQALYPMFFESGEDEGPHKVPLSAYTRVENTNFFYVVATHGTCETPHRTLAAPSRMHLKSAEDPLRADVLEGLIGKVLQHPLIIDVRGTQFLVNSIRWRTWEKDKKLGDIFERVVNYQQEVGDVGLTNLCYIDLSR